MKKFYLLFTFFAASSLVHGATFTNSASVDSFVRASAPTSNYGASGADTVSGGNATNALGTANGVFDTFIRFNTFSMVTNFNTLFGSNNWVINGATLQVTEQSAPNNSLFNRGKGSFEARWIANDAWTEGTGTPGAPGSSGIVYTNETTLLSAATDASLGTYTNAGMDTMQLFSLALPTSFLDDMQAGGEVGLFMTATDPNIGFTFSSRSFTPVTGRPFLIVSAIPRPGIASATVTGSDLNLSCTNGAVGGTYVLLTSSEATTPLSAWTPVATNTPAAGGAFNMTASNVVGALTGQQFFTLQAK
jgi:hypothetical protein